MSNNRDLRDYLQDICDAIVDIRNFIKGMDQKAFSGDKKTVNAVIRSLEVIGEATKKIPPETRLMAPEVPWAEMAGMRDKLIHEYFGVDLDIVWETVQHDLTGLESEIKSLL
ncbi:HepT-like ribonuclease domain-containing protein [Geothermobacter hydrogeniphilus]|uniref:DUF86 domain-containing protein n=1 Tax=Geothermobacter hydrogeniphilus TaxID=1969733 RepID=A0A1X0YBN6_9BACT|nr:DUF86 domain-containing protein [Geothermobacter hydrogeniphilus]ORJ62522.1 hypothetical protein B5V00_04360 [Geothermobacter hydrogeniphilus]